MAEVAKRTRPRASTSSHQRDRFTDQYLPWEQRWQAGKELRERVPREKHAGWTAPKDRLIRSTC